MSNGSNLIHSFQHTEREAGNYNGLTKREYFAALAMQATDLELYAKSYGHKWAEEVAKDSVKMADALLKELENQNP